MTAACTVTVRRGSLCFSRDDHARFLAGVDSVVLLRDGDALLILPVTQAESGGYLLKQRNLAGDRVAHAAGFFREQGIPDELEVAAAAEWSEARAGLLLSRFFCPLVD